MSEGIFPFSAKNIDIFSDGQNKKMFGAFPDQYRVIFWQWESSNFAFSFLAGDEIGHSMNKFSRFINSGIGKCFCYREYNSDFYVSCGGLPGIGEHDLKARFIIRGNAENKLGDSYISSNLGNPNVASHIDGRFSSFRGGFRFSDGSTSFSEGKGYVDDTNRRNENAGTRGNQHKEGPIGHVPLGIKVMLAAPFFAIGLGIGYAALVLDSDPRWEIPLRLLVLLVGSAISTLAFILPFY